VWVNSTGNPGMASGGMGDVLAGMIGGLLAQGVPPAEAARLAVYVHGMVGDRVAERGELGLIASDIVAALPRGLQEVRDSLSV
jgi:NAD(P)H-hydrate epimerase